MEYSFHLKRQRPSQIFQNQYEPFLNELTPCSGGGGQKAKVKSGEIDARCHVIIDSKFEARGLRSPNFALAVRQGEVLKCEMKK